MMRELRAAERAARSQGWRILPTQNGHYRWFDPQGCLDTTTPGTASGSRCARNYLAYLKRGGLVLIKGSGRLCRRLSFTTR